MGKLPYGLQKRVELARALAMEPELLLLDEPMAGMNLEEKEDMSRFIVEVNEQFGTTIALIEHDIGVVMDLSDRVAVLDYGRLIADGDARRGGERPGRDRRLSRRGRPGSRAMDPLYAVLVDPFVQMAALPDFLLQVLWEGLVSGILYALIALGFVLIFKASGVFNFAQGIMVVFAALSLVGLHAAGRAGLRGPGPVRADHARAGLRHRARGSPSAGQPAGPDPVHGHDRAHLLPDRLRRAGLRRRAQGDDHPAAAAADRLLRVGGAGRPA